MGYPSVVSLLEQAQIWGIPTLRGAALLQGASTAAGNAKGELRSCLARSSTSLLATAGPAQAQFSASQQKMFPDGGCFGVSGRRDSFPCYHSLAGGLAPTGFQSWSVSYVLTSTPKGMGVTRLE